LNVCQSAREEALIAERESSGVLGSRNADGHLEGEAIYLSRRASEELQAAIHGRCRQARDAHFELAHAYEFRARLLTDQLSHRGAAEQCYAL
jgi:hypothetical protein